jgi:hypothetical protein
MLGGLAKANTSVAKPRGSESLLFLPLDMLGGLAQSQPKGLSYGPPWAHYLGGYQDLLLGGPLGLLGLCHTTPDGVGRMDYGGGVLE